MALRVYPTILVIALGLADAARAVADGPPPDGAKPLSDIIGRVEKSADFRYVEEVEFEDGLYKVEFYSKDGVEHKFYIDPMTGKPR